MEPFDLTDMDETASLYLVLFLNSISEIDLILPSNRNHHDRLRFLFNKAQN